MSRSAVIGALAVVILVAVVGGTWYWTQVRPAQDSAAAAGRQWICPMHPQVIQDRPGTCPICNMDLVPAGGAEAGPTQSAAAAGPEKPPAVRQWICPMHPQVIQDRPGTCPICNMDLVPADGIDVHAGPDDGAERPEGLVPVRLSEAMVRRIGARSEPVEMADFRREIRAAARVVVDETRYRQVHTKVAGWVERLWADSVGRSVRAGEPLLEIYSPELLAAQQEFLVALRARDRLAASGDTEIAASGAGLAAAARRRLELLDLTPDEIARLEAGGEARRTVTVASPIAGTIIDRFVAQGARIEPGTEVLQVADLSRVWVLASVYEYELPFVREGQAATMVLPYLPGREFRGRVDFVYPTLDPATRTVQVRLQFDNPRSELRPEMFAEVRLVADLGSRLSVPVSAVMDTGTRQVVFAHLEDGTFEPRTLEVGLRMSDRVEVLAGVTAGERVLAEGNFFIDSESRLKAALAGVAAGHSH